ncbi:serine/threonine protein phosphatase, partial [Streptomyces sp. SF28]|nr:serine/threonine protein phosphatase [Streptomyces pinistramenti]
MTEHPTSPQLRQSATPAASSASPVRGQAGTAPLGAVPDPRSALQQPGAPGFTPLPGAGFAIRGGDDAGFGDGAGPGSDAPHDSGAPFDGAAGPSVPPSGPPAAGAAAARAGRADDESAAGHSLPGASGGRREGGPYDGHRAAHGAGG